MKHIYKIFSFNLSVFFIICFAFTAAAQTDFWQQTNGPYGGDVRALAINKSNGYVFAGTFGGGVFRSTDNGENWTPVNIGLTLTSVLSLAIDSKNGDLYAGTGTVFLFARVDGAIFRSTDHGENWTRVNTALSNDNIFTLAINDSGHVFAGTFARGVLRSKDSGKKWVPINNGLTYGDIRALAINSTGHIFAGTAGGRVFRSSDNGENWTQIDNGLTDANVYALTINSNGDIFAGTRRFSGLVETGGAIFRSTNNGETWSLVENLTNNGITSFVINSAGHIFAGTSVGGVFRSTDNGNNWTAVNTGLTNTVANAIAINTNGDVFAGTACGVLRSMDNGGTWKEINKGLIGFQVFSLASRRNGLVLVGTSIGVFRSSDNGESWTCVLTNTMVFSLAINSAGHIFAGTFGNGVFYSTNNGDSWTKVNSGLTQPFVYALASNNSAGHLFAGTIHGGVFRSTDNGGNWTKVNSGLADTTTVLSLAINSKGYIFAGTSPFFGSPINNGIFLSTNNGENWTKLDTGLPDNATAFSLAINSNGHIFAGVPGSGIFRSTNDGDTWQAVITGLTNRDVQSLAVNSKGIIFAGTNGGGVFCSIDNGDTWNAVNSGLTNREVRSLAINDSTGHIFAGTLNGRVFIQVNQPPNIAHTPAALQPNEQQIPIQANIIDDTGIAGAKLNYRRGGEPIFNAVPMANTGSEYQTTIPANTVTSRGVEYFIEATDQKGLKSRWPVAGYFSIQVQVQNEVKPTAQPNGTEQSAYRLISVPLDLDEKNAKAILEDDLGKYDDTKWRFSELRADQTYAEFPNTTAMTPGKAFWLLVKDAGKVFDTGAGKSNITSRRYAIPLHPAWNFVANPFNFPIPVEKISLQSGKPLELRSYSGNWNDPSATPVDTINPFDGYAVFNELSIFDTLLVNPDLSNTPNSLRKNITATATATASATDRWSIRILAQCQQARDVDNLAAIISGASGDFDAWDRPEPPPVGEYVSVSFPHRDWTLPVPGYCIDARPEPLHGEIWEFEVTTNIRDKVNLTFEGVAQVPPEFAVWLVDEALHISQNLRENDQYAVAAAVAAGAGKPKRLKLVVGHYDFVAEKLGESKFVPTRYELSQNFPNPFNPVTTIRYGLPKGERVTLKIYNLLGEEVVTLVDNEPKGAGYHATIWDGRNEPGQIVVSGIYLYQLRIAGFVQTRRMALLR